jgi:hypothetical protein
MQSTGARSQYHAAIVQLRKRTVGWWGGNFSYTFSRLTDNQFGQGNYYSSSPGLQNNYTVIPDSPYYDPDLEYGRSLLDSPHKVVIAPQILLPFGEGRKWMNGGLGNVLLGGWQITPVITIQSGFPIGVSLNVPGDQYLLGGRGTTGAQIRPNIVPGQDFLVPGDITERIRDNTTDNRYLNPDAFSRPAANEFGNAPRILPGVYSPWRNNVDLGVRKEFRTGGSTVASVRLEVLNLFNIVHWAAPASTAVGQSNFAQITNQANNMRMVQFTFRFAF